jgi:hypothetical protein
MRVTDVVYCEQNVQGLILVITAVRMERSAFLAIGEGKETRSLIPHPLWITNVFTKTEPRDLTESVQLIDELKAKNNTLLQVLKSLATSPNLDPTESADVRGVINAVGFTISSY